MISMSELYYKGIISRQRCYKKKKKRTPLCASLRVNTGWVRVEVGRAGSKAFREEGGALSEGAVAALVLAVETV